MIGSIPGVAEHPGCEPFSEGMRQVPRHRGPHERRHAQCTELFGWGSPWWIARMIRNPRSSDKYGFLDEKQPGQMPAFGDDQITSGDSNADSLFEGRLREARAGAVGSH